MIISIILLLLFLLHSLGKDFLKIFYLKIYIFILNRIINNIKNKKI